MKLAALIGSFLCVVATGLGQNVGIGTSTPHASAQLEVNSSSKGLLPPRLTTTQRDAIDNPAAGLLIFNSSTNTLQLRTVAEWISISQAPAVFLPTVVIGTQQWMAKNLDVAFYRNGDAIPRVDNLVTFANLTTGAWCYFQNDSTLGGTYGKLYNWYAVNDPRGLAPQGWHIPTAAEWSTLENKLGGTATAGKQLKVAGTNLWFPFSPAVTGNNNSGFTALPGGYRVEVEDSNMTAFGLWRSATETNATEAWCRFLGYERAELSGFDVHKSYGGSVRCIRD